jgi:hypothetical protein
VSAGPEAAADPARAHAEAIRQAMGWPAWRDREELRAAGRPVPVPPSPAPPRYVAERIGELSLGECREALAIMQARWPGVTARILRCVPAGPAPGSMPGAVVGNCGHDVDRVLWQAGWRCCAHCPELW